MQFSSTQKHNVFDTW